MSNLNLFISTAENLLLAGLNAPSAIDPGSLPLNLGDTINLQIYLLNKSGSTLQSFNPYTIVPNSGLALVVYLDDGKANGTVYTNQVTFTNDPSLIFFTGSLALNTTALATLLGANTSATCYLQVGYLQNGVMITVLSVLVTVSVGVYGVTGGTLTNVPAGLTPLSVQAANQMYVAQNGAAGAGFIMTSPAGKQFLIQIKDNIDGSGQFDASPIN